MRVARLVVLGIVGLLVVLQLVPYGRDHSNPPVVREAPWNSPEARQIAVNACYDCHSNQTKWRWYSNVAPASWWVQNDVEEGRSALNFSEWDQRQQIGEMVEIVSGGEMPPRSYLLVHPSAKLSSSEKEVLVAALRALQQDGGRR